jgi:hypothetical protein
MLCKTEVLTLDNCDFLTDEEIKLRLSRKELNFSVFRNVENS